LYWKIGQKFREYDCSFAGEGKGKENRSIENVNRENIF
jgi:hypothetical protein